MAFGAKQKGSEYEREISRLYVEYGIDPKSTRMPLSGADSVLKGDVRHAHDNAIPFRFVDECKRQERINIPEYWKQTLVQCGFGEEPVLHFRQNHQESLTIIRTATFMTLLKTIMDLTYSEERAEKKEGWDNKNAQYKLDQALNLIKQSIKLLGTKER